FTKKTKVKRAPKRGHYDQETIFRILDEERVCHVGFVHEGFPVVIPTAYGRKDNVIYLHGANSSRMMTNLAEGVDVCVAVTQENGLVLAKSAFHHSMNYASVVVFGKAQKLTDPDEINVALKAISDHLLADRWEETRLPNAKELKATMVLALPLDEASAKIRTGPPSDDPADVDLDIWVGVLPLKRTYEAPEAADYSKGPIPPSVRALYE
ncbi:MAG: pyridoxamine 5'-phosphate oxidase family protein, partial [Bacteroidia bacterium]